MIYGTCGSNDLAAHSSDQSHADAPLGLVVDVFLGALVVMQMASASALESFAGTKSPFTS